MITLLSYQGMIQSIFVGSSTFSIESTCASTHLRHRLTEGEQSDPIINPQFTAEQWLSVLVLSTKYDMETIRQSTIAQLQVVSPRLDPTRQIAMARRYNCPALVDEPIQTLTNRTLGLTLKEMQNLPIEDLHTIIEGRETRTHRPTCFNCSSTTFRCNGCRITTTY